MINQRIIPVIIILFGLLVIFLPNYILPVCDPSAMAHSKTGQAHQMEMNHPQMPHKINEPMHHHEMENHMMNHTMSNSPCYWSAKAEIGVGFVITLLGLFIFFIKSEQIRLGLTLSLICLSGLVAAIPTLLIGVCSSEMMRCRIGTLPGLLFLSGILFLVTVTYAFYLKNRIKIKNNNN